MTRPRPGQRHLAATALAALALAGCGGHDGPHATGAAVKSDQRAVLDAIDALQTAGRHGDGRAICERLFTAKLARSVATASHRSCQAEVRERLGSPSEAISVQRDVRIARGTATATIREQTGAVSTLLLVEQDGRWRIARVLPRTSS
jgi:hypothetical protein